MQRIDFHNILPYPLMDTPLEGVIWNNTVTFNAGDNYLIQADSGRGKSTLLNIIYGTRKDYSGTVRFDENDIQNFDSNSFCTIRENKIAYLFQDLRLFPQLTALQNIQIKPGCILGRDEIDTYAEKLGVTDQLHKICGKLSLGQQQRIALIRAVSQRFEWLLLDEPFSHLDARNTALAGEIIKGACDKNKAGIIATSLGHENSGFQGFKIMEL